MLLALPGNQHRPYRQALGGIYTKRIRAAVLDRTGDTVANLTSAFQGGEVRVDARADVTRAAMAQVLDPKHAFGFDADTYQGGDLDLTRMLRIFWVIDSPLLASTVTIPVFTGPFTRLSRDGALVTIEAQGKEAYGLTPSRRTLTIKKGARKTDAIKTILRERMGETRLAGIPDLDARLPANVVVGPKDLPWKVAEHIADSMNRQLFYDAAAVPILRPRPQRVSWQFRSDSDNGTPITSPIRVSADLQNVKNHVKVTGATPKGKKQPIYAIATADRTHPLSPWRLGPPDAPMWLIEEVSNDHLRSVKECQRLANRKLRDGLRLIHDVSFNAAPVPHLEPLDLVGVASDYESATTRLETFTLPLGLGGDMTVGYVDPFTLKRR